MKILAVDYGDSRTGLATCDRTEFLTTAITPQITLKARNKVAARVCEVAEEIGAELIVIGLPLNMDGTEGERAAKSRKLAKTVEIWSGLPVRMWDERQTTCAAADLLDESGTFGTKRKEILDSVSATVILDDYLAWRKEHPGEIYEKGHLTVSFSYSYCVMLTLLMVMSSLGFWFSSTAVWPMASTTSMPSYTCPNTVSV